MGLENARDSFVDLLQIKAEKQELQRLLDEEAGGSSSAAAAAHQQQQGKGNIVRPVGVGSGGGSGSNNNNKPLKKQTSFRVKRGSSSHAALSAAAAEGGYYNDQMDSNTNNLSMVPYEELIYEPCEVEEDDEEHWPVWEMTGDDPWQDTQPRPSTSNNKMHAGMNGDGGGHHINNGGYYDIHTTDDSSVFSIADCERIFTVPEVYDEIMKRRRAVRMSSLTMRNHNKSGRMHNHYFDDDNGSEKEQGICFNILNCLNPWRKQQQQHHENNALNDSQYYYQDHNIASNNKHDAFIQSMNPDNEHKHNEDEKEDKLLNPKGVMKRSSMAVQLYLGMPASVRQSFTPSMFNVILDDNDGNDDLSDDPKPHTESNGGEGTTRCRASIVGKNNKQFVMGVGMDSPSSQNDHDPATTVGIKGNKEAKKQMKSRKDKYKVHFSELKQVLRVRKFSPDEAVDVWFQRDDFDFFKNEMTLLIQEDGAARELSEVWLEANENAYRRGSTVSEASDAEEEEQGCGDNGGGGVVGSSSLNNNLGSHFRDDSNASSSGGSNAHRTSSSRSWWHDYDHSRRGLERYASPGQARQILASYKVAVQKVLSEQQRQQCLGCFCIPGARDPEKIAEVYHEYTAWSRDLALAAGASDADAVRTNFDDDKRHTREYYMLKQVVASGYKVHKHMPQFMLPKCITPKGFLDEAESLYLDDRDSHQHNRRHHHANHSGRSSTNFVGSMVRNAAAGVLVTSNLSGEEARNEMSRLDSKDLEGPVSPALAPSLQAKESGGGDTSSSCSSRNNRPLSPKTQKKTMAEKAKNYPFQQ